MFLILTWGLLLLMPIIGLFASLSPLSRSTKVPLTIAGVFLFVIIIAVLAGLSFTLPAMNVLALALAYGVYSFLVCAGWGLPTSKARNIFRIVTALPIACGYVLGILGPMGFLFIAWPYVEPRHSTKIADNFYCEPRTHGGWPSQDVSGVRLIQRLPVPPYLQIRRQSMTFDENSPHKISVTEACQELMVRHKS